jgi:membrane protein implicated in regulation of membrane protease activity
MLDLEITFWHWGILSAALLGLEIVAPGVIFVWMAISAAVVAGLLYAAPNLVFEYQLILFAVLSIAAVVSFRKFFKPSEQATDQPSLNRRGEQYVGRIFTLVEPIENGDGKIVVDDSTWRIRGIDDLPAGSRVKVISADGVLLNVEQHTSGS